MNKKLSRLKDEEYVLLKRENLWKEVLSTINPPWSHLEPSAMDKL